ncbi:MAG TPA: YkoF family thiamine/hydroxymethylpyrimidine-binding protein [Bacteroidales bacterium]|nr:YkoF family thiamine/hydroxymethylpyrimidine-binding protein [Bacteroidales bacterium]
MKVSLDISYYPLCDDFIPHILDFIERLNQYQNIKVQTNGLSTQLFGDYAEVMDILKKEMAVSFQIPHSVFVIKFVNSDRSC